MARKKEQAFRTITEVSEWLKTPSHVLRFWESKFTQIKPVKRAGGRRYYRPEDLKVIGGIKHLLHDKGTTIAAVKELFKSKGEKHIKEYSIEPIFPNKTSRKSKTVNEKLANNIHLDTNQYDLKENVHIIDNQTNSFEKITILPHLLKNNELKVEELYFQLKRIRNRMKRRLEGI
ncbi:MerR family transcriptional regulator [Amylibacter sp.]|nr:MerR family transcriptional regulator [Amylibacter sp.]